MNKMITICLLLAGATVVHAQTATVESLTLVAQAEEGKCRVRDYNGECCALLRVQFTDKGVEFASDWIIRTEARSRAEHWAWLCDGTRDITVKSDLVRDLYINFADHNPQIKALKGGNTYLLKLRLDGGDDSLMSVPILCNHPDAQLYVDGTPHGTASGTVMLPAGMHVVRAVKKGYFAFEDTVTIMTPNPYMRSQSLTIPLDEEITDPDEQYRRGNGGGSEQKMRWLLRAAKQGHVEAQVDLGYAYMYGSKGVDKDRDKAVYWYTMAAKQGNLKACNQLGFIYHIYHPMDNVLAAYWSEKAAQLGNAEAMYSLGQLYAYGGNGLVKDEKKSFEWYKKAAEHGYAYAMPTLGLYYEHREKYAEAAYWYQKAIDAGLDYAKDYLKSVKKNQKHK